MQHKKDLYELYKVELDDIYKDNSIYLNKKNTYIPTLDEELEPYKDLITKAITILEQEPMCGEIILASISKDKSTEENPMVWLIYKDSISKMPCKGYFISKKEIEKIFKSND